MPYKDKEDAKVYQKKYYLSHKEEYSQISKQWYLNNKKRLSEQRKQHYADNKEDKKQYYQNHRKEICEKRRIYREKNREEINKKLREYYQKSKELSRARGEKYKERRNILLKNKRRTDLKFNLNNKMSNMINCSLRNGKNGRHWETLIDYTLNDLMKHLNLTMPMGYCWQNFLNGDLHIDHIIPKSAFNFTKSNHFDFKRCWELSNLQLLPAEENLIKSDKIFASFQPCLKI